MIRASNNPTECTPVRLAQSLGEFASLAALQAAYPTAAAGSYAVVNVADGDDLVYYFSVSDNAWFTHSGGSGTTPTLQQIVDESGDITNGSDYTSLSALGISATDFTYFMALTKAMLEFSNSSTKNSQLSASGLVVTDDTDSASITKTGLEILGAFGQMLLQSGYLYISDGGANETYFHKDKITFNGVDFLLPSGASSPFATLADIPSINENYKGTYTSLSALQTAHPTAALGNYAMVDTGSGSSSKLYIWDAQDGWVLSSNASPSTTDALIEGSTNLYFTVARVLATALTGLSTSDGSDVTSANSILVAIGKLQKQLTDVRAAKEDKRSYMSQSSPRFLDNTTALQKIFNVGSSGNGSIAVTSGRKYRVRGWAVFSALTSTSKNVSFGVLGTATASYVSGIGFGTISSAVSNPTLQALTSFSQTQIASNAAVSAGRIYIDFEFNCNGSGTFIPSVAFSAAQANMQVDSAYCEITDIGSSSDTSTSNIV